MSVLLKSAARGDGFADYKSRYTGRSCYVIGRGPTRFDYRQLAAVDEPIFFLNDAVCLENLARSETFFFAHDQRVARRFCEGIRSTAILPDHLEHAADRRPIVSYRVRGERCESLLMLSRDEIARARTLYAHSGTMHSVLHFVWFCGFKRVVFVGCDGINDRAGPGYDARLPNLSCTSPGWNYATIRSVQDCLLRMFGIEAIYRGAPTASSTTTESISSGADLGSSMAVASA